MPPSTSPPPQSQPPPQPQPAIPILASSLLDLEIKQRAKFGGGRISTACKEVDEILGGGFERGIVVGISCDGGSEEGIMVSEIFFDYILEDYMRVGFMNWRSEMKDLE